MGGVVEKERAVRPDATVEHIYLLVASAHYHLGTEAPERWTRLVIPGLAGTAYTWKLSHR